MSDSIVIHLAKQSFTIEPFTVGQLADLHISSNEPQSDINTKEGAEAFWSRNVGILSIALRRPRDEVEKMKLGGMKEISTAIMDIMVFSEIWSRIVPGKESPPGEAQAAAA